MVLTLQIINGWFIINYYSCNYIFPFDAKAYNKRNNAGSYQVVVHAGEAFMGGFLYKIFSEKMGISNLT